MDMPPYRKVLIAVFLVCALIASIMAAALVYDRWIRKTEGSEAILEVEEVYFLLVSSEGGKYNISSKMFITNSGDKDCRAKVRGFIIDRVSNIAMDDAESDIGTVPAGKTVETSLDMEVLYNGSFKVEILVFKNGLITVKGSGIVNLAAKGGGGQDYQNTATDPTDEKDEKTPFPGIASLVMAAVVTALVLTLIKRRRWSM